MWEIAALAIPKAVGREGKRLYCFPLFPSGRHFHRGRRGVFRFVVQSVELTRVLLVADLLAVGMHLRLALYVLLCLDDRKSVAEPLVLNDGSVAYSLVFAKKALGSECPSIGLRACRPGTLRGRHTCQQVVEALQELG
jgi:hypothetical protein